MKNFFFDTADASYIEAAFIKLKGTVDRNLITGITTNPNAFHKIGKYKLHEWFDQTKRLCDLIADIRQDSKGIVFIQCPNADMSSDEVFRYAEMIYKLSDRNENIGLKIPPYDHILKIVNSLENIVKTNVTGLSDAGTALKCLSYPVSYVSIIPGRMEEVGIDAKSNLAFLNNCNVNMSSVITGSMRTIEQVIWTFQYNTIPTIGERVFNLIFDGNNLDDVLNIDYNININSDTFCPIIDEKNTMLSEQFFEQMNDLGKTAYEDFTRK